MEPKKNEQQAEENNNSFTLMSQNLWCHFPMSLLKPFVFGTMPGWAMKRRIAVFAENLPKDVDFLCVQEIWVFKLLFLTFDGNFKLLVELLADKGFTFHTSYHSSKFDAKHVGQNSGLAIFSKHPILRSEHFDFTATSESLNCKGLVVADIQLLHNNSNSRRKIVRVGCTHFDAFRWNYKRQQISQVASSILQFQDAYGEADGGTVLCGDFNIAPQPIYDDGSPYRFLAFELASKLALREAIPPHECVPTHVEGSTLDHVFYSSKNLALGGENTHNQNSSNFMNVKAKKVVVDYVRDPKSLLAVSDHKYVHCSLVLLN